ncbi:MAG: CpsB/CapC family capsule biosynthesis tyrosine phosphatase, partial [Clostridium sp.]
DYNLAVGTIKYAFEKGVKKMVMATKQGILQPNISAEEMGTRFKILSEKLNNDNVGVKVYLAQNVVLAQDNLRDCLGGKFMGINDSKYMLIDLQESMTEEKLDMLFELTLIGIIPVIAHPERCKEIIVNISKVEKLKELGCLLELDINSLNGLYGKRTKKIAEKLLKLKEYHLVASEVSEELNRKNRYNYSSLSKAQKEYFNKNSIKVLMNEEVNNIQEVKKTKKKLFGFLN